MVKPTGTRIIIEMIEDDVIKTDSGIIVGKVDKDKMDTLSGKVLSVGQDVKEIKEGDTVFMEKHAVFNISMGGKDYAVVQEASVIGYERDSENNERVSINEGE